MIKARVSTDVHRRTVIRHLFLEEQRVNNGVRKVALFMSESNILSILTLQKDKGILGNFKLVIISF